MNIAISLALAVVPALFILFYISRRDRLRPEPRGAVFRIFLLGIATTVPAIVIELLLEEIRLLQTPAGFLYPAFKAFVVTGLVEESLKLFVVMRYAFRKHYFNEVMDGIVFTVAAGMGFACLENVLYVLGKGISVGVLRAFTSVPMHGAASVIMGYYIGKAHFSIGGKRRFMVLKGFLLAVLFHGLYNLSIFGMPYWTPLTVLGLIPVLVIAIVMAVKKIKRALKDDDIFFNSD